MKKVLAIFLVLSGLMITAWLARSREIGRTVSSVTPASLPPASDRGVPQARPATAPAPAAASAPAGEDPAGLLAALNAKSEKPWQPTLDVTGKWVRTLAMGLGGLPAGSPSAQARAFVATYARGLFGVAPTVLDEPVVSTTDRTKITFAQKAGEYRILGGSLSLIFDDGKLVRVMSDLVPCGECALSAAADFPAEEAQKQALRAVKAAEGTAPPKLDRTVAYRVPGQLLPAYVYYLQPQGTAGPHYEILVDAHAGHVLRTRDVIIH